MVIEAVFKTERERQAYDNCMRKLVQAEKLVFSADDPALNKQILIGCFDALTLLARNKHIAECTEIVDAITLAVSRYRNAQSTRRWHAENNRRDAV